MHSFAGPDPHAGGDAHDHRHQVLDHEYLEPRVVFPVHLLRTRNGVVWVFADIAQPRDHPVVEEEVFVEQAGDHNQGGNGVEDGEDEDSDHQFFELVGFGAVVFHHGADAVQGDEAGRQEDGAEDQVDAEGDQDEDAHRLHVPYAHVAHAAQNIPWNNNRTVEITI